MTTGFFSGDILRGLAARVLLFLSLALLPIGLISIVQTREISEQSRINAELSLLAVTEQVSAAEQRVLQEAFGAADALGSFVRLKRDDDAECSEFLREYQEVSGIYTFVGFIAKSGRMGCSSSGEVMDFSANPVFNKAISTKTRRATAVRNGLVSKRDLTVVNVPVFEDGESIGVMAISIPFETFSEIDEPELAFMPLAMMTFNQDGRILTTERGRELVEQELPADIALSALSGTKAHVLLTENSNGEERAYAVMPIVPDTVFAISVWPRDTPFLESDLSSRLSALLPIIMWLASLIVAFWALNRLAITHIRKLGRQMRRFALNRTLPRETLDPSVPTELVDMESTFIEMAGSIMRDEATLEDNLRQKNILLKEVHHRVKNNLQLISSIMNMQIRQAKNSDSKFVLQRLQERILSLATVHENLYKNDDLVRVDASTLLYGSVNQLLSVGLVPGSNVKVTQNYEKITLDPDDAAPLTLLATEGVTNALKYVSRPTGEEVYIKIELSYASPHIAELIIENSVGQPPDTPGTGLGAKLISAFTRQLNGDAETTEVDGVYRLRVKFPVPMCEKPVHDY